MGFTYLKKKKTILNEISENFGILNKQIESNYIFYSFLKVIVENI